jgi:hypothetical protein
MLYPPIVWFTRSLVTAPLSPNWLLTILNDNGFEDWPIQEHMGRLPLDNSPADVTLLARGCQEIGR